MNALCIKLEIQRNNSFNAVDRLDQLVGDPEISGRVHIVVTKCLSFNRELYAAQLGTIVARLNDFSTL